MPKKTKIKTEENNTDNIKTDEQGMAQDNVKEIFNSVGELVVDVFETDSEFVVLSAIAGIQIKDLDISVDKDMMVISGARQDPHENIEKRYIWQECYWGPFSKKIVLPENIDVEKADAQMSRGVLVIKIPRLKDIKKETIDEA